MNSRDKMVLSKIVQYCGEIEGACRMFEKETPNMALRQNFIENHIFRNACCMCIIQIGELAGKLTEEALDAIPDIPWKQIRGMRNICAHNYGNIDAEHTWETIINDIPVLKAECEACLSKR